MLSGALPILNSHSAGFKLTSCPGAQASPGMPGSRAGQNQGSFRAKYQDKERPLYLDISSLCRYVKTQAGVRPKLALRPLQRSQLEKCWVDHRLVARETDSKAVLWQIMCSSVSGPLQYPGYLKAVWPGFLGATTNPWHWSAGLIFGATGTTG